MGDDPEVLAQMVPGLEEEVARLRPALAAALDRQRRLEEEVAALRKLLTKYGKHYPTCASHSLLAEIRCNCGLVDGWKALPRFRSAALAALPIDEEENDARPAQ